MMTWDSVIQQKMKLRVSVTICSLNTITALQCMIKNAMESITGYAEKGRQYQYLRKDRVHTLPKVLLNVNYLDRFILKVKQNQHNISILSYQSYHLHI